MNTSMQLFSIEFIVWVLELILLTIFGFVFLMKFIFIMMMALITIAFTLLIDEGQLFIFEETI